MKKPFVSLFATYLRAVVPLLRGNSTRARTDGAAVNKAILAMLGGGVALFLVAFAVVKIWAACEPPGSVVPTQPYVCTERDNYNAGEDVAITGVAFQPGETVELVVGLADGTPATGEGHDPWQVVADADGNFETTWHVCDDECELDSVLLLSATGLSSGLSAQAFFTDATTTERAVPCTGMLENFNAMGSNAVVFIPMGFVIDSSSATARNPNPPVYNDATNTVSTTQSAGTIGPGVLNSTSTGGIYNFGNGTNATATDRALGFLNSGSFGTPRTIMLGVSNSTAGVIQTLTITWNYEKYRSGSRAHNWTFFSSTDGTNWTAQTAGNQSYAADAGNTVVSNPPQQIPMTVILTGVNIPVAGKLYFRWTLTGVGGTPSSDTNGQGLGIDDVTVIPGTPTLTAMCQSISRSLASTSPGTVTVNATEIDNGSSGSGCVTLSYGIRKGTSGSFGSSVSFDCSEIGANTVQLQVTDQTGDSATCTATVKVLDTTAPVVTCPSDQSAVCNNGGSGAVVNYPAATAIDSCEGAETVTCTPPSGTVFPKCTTTVTCTASDSSGNIGSAKFLVTVTDTAGPVVTCPPDQTAECNNGSAVVNYPAATAYDVCEGAETVTCTPPSGSTFTKGVTTVTCTASDSSGNTGSCSFAVTVVDTTAPTFSNCPSVPVSSSAVLAFDDFGDGSRFKTGATDFDWFRANFLGTSVRPELNIITDTILGGAGNQALQLGASSDSLEPAVGVNGFNLTTLASVGDAIELSMDFHLTGTNRDSASGVRIGLYNSNGTPVTADQTQQSNDDFGYYISIPTGPTNRLLRLNKEIGGGPDHEIGSDGGGDVQDETSVSTKVGNSNISDNTTKYTFRLTVTKTATGVQVVGRVDGGTIAASITFNDNTNALVSFDEIMINEGDGQDYVIDNVVVSVPTVCNGGGGAVITYPTPTAFDACEGAETVTCTPASGSTFPVGNSTVTCTASDSSGNAASCQFTVVVPDTTAPVMTCPANQTAECNNGSAVVNYPAATAIDACEGAETVTCTPASGSTFATGTNTVTCTASDSSGNTNSCQFTVTVVDTTAPVVTCPGAITQGNDPNLCSAVVTYSASASDACEGALTPSCNPPSGSTFPVGNSTVTCTASDSIGNTGTCSFTVTVNDTQAPNLSCPPNKTVECPGDTSPTATGQATATDNCGSATVTSSDSIVAGCGNTKTITRTWTATDPSGNSTSCTQTITVVDTTTPSLINVPANTTASCDNVPAPANNVTATDACDPNPTVSFSQTSTQTPSGCGHFNYTITRTWSAKDACNNTSSQSQTITVSDTTAPVLSGQGADATIECPATPSFTAPTASDNCDPNPTITFSDVTTPGRCAQEYGVTRTWTAKDACGNTSAPVSQTITVKDTTAPTLNNVPANTTASCDNVPAPANNVTATDACDPNPTVSFSQTSTQTASGCGHFNYTITRTWSAKDACNNTSSQSQTITVSDTTAPVLSGQGADATIECPATPSFTAPTASDNCDPNPTISFTDSTTPLCGATYKLTRVWTAQDVCGNTSAPVSQTITVKDTTAPTLINVPANATASCDNVPAPANNVTATDVCDPNPTVSFSQTSTQTPSGCGHFNYTITRTWSAKDACNNTSSQSQTITVSDTTAPVLSGQGADATIECPATPSFTAPTASDNCDPNPTISFTDSTTPLCGATYKLTRVWTAQDACGNTSAPVSQTITVVDTTQPVLNGVPANATVECDAVPAAANVTATDSCDPNPTVSFQQTRIDGNCPNNYTLTRTWTAKDACNNSATATQTITVNDTTAPAISCPADVTTNTDAGQCYASGVVLGSATATDNCSGSPTVVNNAPSHFAKGSTLVIWTATDACGNSATCTQKVIVVDNQAPVLSGCPAPTASFQCLSAVPAPATVTAADACDSSVAVSFSETQSNPGSSCHNTITRTWTATDSSGNNATCSQTITVNDTIAPTISCPADKQLACGASTDPSSTGTATATDNCGGSVKIEYVDTPTPANCTGQAGIDRVWTATDACGNSASCTQHISFVNSQAPQITTPVNQTVESTQSHVPSFTGYATATVACGAPATVTYSDSVTPGNCPNNCTITRTWTATDGCGNSTSSNQSITVQDTTAPVISSGPADATVQCASQVPAADNSSVTASDAGGGTVTITHDADVISNQTCPNRYTISRTYHATDACGNSSGVTQTITVNDTTAPVISCPADVTTNTDVGQCYASGVVLGSATATDNCSGSPTVVNNAPSQFPKGSTLVIWTATDACGNSATCTQKVIVVDNQAPVLSGCPALTASFQCLSAVPAPAVVTAADACDNSVAVSFSETQSNPGSSCHNTITRTWTATDVSGNSSTCTQTITVNDTTAPVITSSPANVTVQCASAVPAANDSQVVATDNCGGAVTITHDADVISAQTCPNRYTISRTYHATDSCGNSSSVTQTITINDTTAPVITSSPANVTVQCASAVPAANNSQVVATDNCGGAVTITHDADVISGQTCPNRYTISRTYHATDSCGNSSSVTQTITVNDTTAPTMTCPANVTQPAGSGQCSAAVNYATPTASDNCGTASVVCAPPSGSTFQKGASSVVCTATDACGNTSTCSFTVTVTDTQNPTIACHANIVTNTAPGQCQSAALTYAPTASDNCPGVTSSCAPPSGSTFAKGTNTVVCTATDASGNTANCSFTVTVVDSSVPTITPPANVTVQCPSLVPPHDFAGGSATDTCSGVTVTWTGDVTNNMTCPNRFTITRTYKATDSSGNSTTCQQTITVNDTTRPTITCPTNIVVSALSLCTNAVPATNPTIAAFLHGVTASDNCGGTATVTNNAPSLFTLGTNTVTFTATDSCGNTTNCQAKVIVVMLPLNCEPIQATPFFCQHHFDWFGNSQFATFEANLTLPNGDQPCDFRTPSNTFVAVSVTIGTNTPVVVYCKNQNSCTVQSDGCGGEAWEYFGNNGYERAIHRFVDNQCYNALMDPNLPSSAATGNRNCGSLTTVSIGATSTRFYYGFQQARQPITIVVDGIVLLSVSNNVATSPFPYSQSGKTIQCTFPERLIPGNIVQWYATGNPSAVSSNCLIYSQQVQATGTATATYYNDGGTCEIQVPTAGLNFNGTDRSVCVQVMIGQPGVSSKVGCFSFCEPLNGVGNQDWQYGQCSNFQDEFEEESDDDWGSGNW